MRRLRQDVQLLLLLLRKSHNQHRRLLGSLPHLFGSLALVDAIRGQLGLQGHFEAVLEDSEAVSVETSQFGPNSSF